MLDALHSDFLTPQKPVRNIPIFAQKALDRCHIVFPDSPDPTGAIIFENKYYAYVKFFEDQEKAKKVAQRLVGKGNEVILTRVRKGLVLWVLEPDAQRIGRIVH